MSNDWARDVNRLHIKMGHTDAIKKLDPKMMKELLKFRVSMLDEEMAELKDAIKDKDPENIVDALIDLMVFAIGTLDAFEVDPYKAWNVVQNANEVKSPGIKPERPNKFGLPDMIKPAGWEAPTHTGNHGRLSEIF